MANILFTVKDSEQLQYTGSLKLVPRGVKVSGSALISARWIERDTCQGFFFENVVEGLYELTGSSQQIEDHFGLLLVPTGSGTYDGGDLQVPPSTATNIWVPASTVSASWASSSLSSSWATNALTASYVTASGVRGSVLSASYALTASYALNAPTGTGAIASGSSLNITASHALTASYALNATPTVSASWASASLSSSYARSGSVAITASYALSSSYGLSGSYAVTASHAGTALSASFVTASDIRGTVASSSYALTASYVLNSVTASYATFAVSATSASYGASSSAAVSSSYSATASLATSATINGATNSGNYFPLFGVATTSPQTTPLYFDGNYLLTYNPGTDVLTVLNVSASTLTGSLSGTASVAITASYVSASSIRGTVTSASFALSASYAPPFTIASGSTWNILVSTASVALTASHALNLRASASLQGVTILNSILSGSTQLTEATAGLALYLDSQKAIRTGYITEEQMGYLSSINSDLQTQLDSRWPRPASGSTWPFTSSVAVSASFAPMGNTASGDFLITKAGNVTSLFIRGETMGGNAVTMSSTPAGLTISDTVYVSGDVYGNNFIGNADTATLAYTASSLLQSVTASNLKIVWASASLFQNTYGGVELRDLASGNTLYYNEGGKLTLYNVGLDNGTPNRVVVSDGTSSLITSEVTTEQLDYLLGVTSNIQAQLDAKQPRIGTGSLVPITASYVLSSSLTVSSSYAQTSSLSSTASLAYVALFTTAAVSASYTATSSVSVSSSYVATSSFAQGAIITGATSNGTFLPLFGIATTSPQASPVFFDGDLNFSFNPSANRLSVAHITASTLTGSHLGNTIGTASCAVSASKAVSASYAETGSFLNGFYHIPFSKVLPYTGSQAIIHQMVTGSFTTFTFDYMATSASVYQRGKIDAVIFSGSVNHNWYGILENAEVNLTMSVRTGSNAIQLVAEAPQYWTFRGWTIFI